MLGGNKDVELEGPLNIYPGMPANWNWLVELAASSQLYSTPGSETLLHTGKHVKNRDPTSRCHIPQGPTTYRYAGTARNVIYLLFHFVSRVWCRVWIMRCVVSVPSWVSAIDIMLSAHYAVSPMKTVLRPEESALGDDVRSSLSFNIHLKAGTVRFFFFSTLPCESLELQLGPTEV